MFTQNGVLQQNGWSGVTAILNGQESLPYIPATKHTGCTITGLNDTFTHGPAHSSPLHIHARANVIRPGNLSHTRSGLVCDMNPHSRAYQP